MPLVLALKNRDTVVVAGDIDQPGATSSGFSQLIQLPNRSVLLIAGNLDAVRHVVTDTVIPRITSDHAALVLELVPHLSQLKGRVEFIVAGIDPIRHIEEPGLYYLDSAQGFNLTLVKGDAVAAGSTAAISSLLQGHSFAGSTIDQLKVLAKECVSATKLRWPAALANHLRLGVITAQNTRFQDF
jgi:20S proteasome alpha/beta subunit